VKLRGELDLKKIRPLERATYAGAVDNLGGEVLSWMLSSMKFGGTVAAIGLAASPALNTTVMPFILRGVSLLGINSTDVPTRAEHEEVWRRLSTDMRPPQLASMARTIPFEALPSAFDDFIASRVKGASWWRSAKSDSFRRRSRQAPEEAWTRAFRPSPRPTSRSAWTAAW